MPQLLFQLSRPTKIPYPRSRFQSAAAALTDFA
jgi:hypothetical protein